VSEQLVGRPNGLLGPCLVSEQVRTACSEPALVSEQVRTACSEPALVSEQLVGRPNGLFVPYFVSERLVRSQLWCPNSFLFVRTVCSGLIFCPNGLFGSIFVSERLVRSQLWCPNNLLAVRTLCSGLFLCPNGLFGASFGVQTACWPSEGSVQAYYCVYLVSERLVRSQLWCPNSLLAVITVSSGQFLCPNGLFGASFGVRTACWPSERSARAYYCVYLVSEWLVRSQLWCPNSLLAVQMVCLGLIWCPNSLLAVRTVCSGLLLCLFGVRMACSEPALVSEQLVGRPNGLFGPDLVSKRLVRSQLWCLNSLFGV
jgi:hypothetical protein